MDYLTGPAWVRFVSERLSEVRSGMQMLGRRNPVMVFANRLTYVNVHPRKPLCIANDNSLPTWTLGRYELHWD